MIHLLKPNPGEIHINPQTEILLSFQNIPGEDWTESVNISVNNKPAVEQGVLHPDFETTRCSRSKDTGRWGIRSTKPIDPGDVFVQASCGTSRSHNQRFFISGAKADYSPQRPSTGLRGKDWHPAGWFWVHENGWKTPFGSLDADVYPSRLIPKAGKRWMVVYPKRGLFQYSEEGEIIEETFRPVEEDAQVDVIHTPREWRIVAADSNGVHTYGPDRETHWTFDADSVAIADEMIHARLGRLSFHLPLHYEPAMSENTLESWYMEDQHLSDGNIDFYDGLCLVWNDEKMIARHDFDPLLGTSDDMLWTSGDIDARFESVRIIDSCHVLVNDQMYLNTRHPKIQPV